MSPVANVIGWIWNGEYYCCVCAPTNDEDEESLAIFDDANEQHYCCICGEPIPAKET